MNMRAYPVLHRVGSAGFAYRLDRLKPRVSKFRASPAKEYNIVNTVIGLGNWEGPHKWNSLGPLFI